MTPSKKQRSYLQGSPGTYKFRRSIPKSLQAEFAGKKERIVRLTRADSIAQAEEWAREENLRFEQELELAKAAAASRARRTAHRAPDIETQDYSVLAQAYVVSMLAADDVERNAMTETEYAALGELIRDGLAQRRAQLARGDLSGIRDAVEAALASAGRSMPQNEDARKALEMTVLRADVDSLQQQLRRHDGEVVPTPAFPAGLGVYEGEGFRGARGYVDELYGLWKRRQRPSQKTLHESDLAFQRLAKFMGADDSAFWESKKTHLPPPQAVMAPSRLHITQINRRVARNFKNYLLDEVISPSSPGRRGVSAKTAKKSLSLLSAVFNFARAQFDDEEGLPGNPFERLWVKNEIGRGGELKARISFSSEQLQRLFAAPMYGDLQQAIKDEAPYWLFPLGLFTGARLDELARLQTEDVRAVDGGHLLRITAKEETGTLKTNTSFRDIPIHEELIKIGFLELVNRRKAAGQKWIFPALERTEKDGFSGPLSKRLNRLIDKHSVKSPRITFHSLRHSFKDICDECDIPEKVSDALTGHASSSVGRKYGKGRLSNEVLFREMPKAHIWPAQQVAATAKMPRLLRPRQKPNEPDGQRSA